MNDGTSPSPAAASPSAPMTEAEAVARQQVLLAIASGELAVLKAIDPFITGLRSAKVLNHVGDRAAAQLADAVFALREVLEPLVTALRGPIAEPPAPAAPPEPPAASDTESMTNG